METTKELAVVEKKVKNAIAQADTYLVITSDAQLAEAAEYGVNVKKLSKFITAEKEKITKPMNDALKAARSLFAPLEKGIEEAERKVKDAMGKYHDAQEAKRAADAEKIAARVEKGTMRQDTAIRKTEELGTTEKKVHTETGAVQFSKVRKVRFLELKSLSCADLNALANSEYIQWNEVATRKAALATEAHIPGTEVYEETQTAIG